MEQQTKVVHTNHLQVKSQLGTLYMACKACIMAPTVWECSFINRESRCEVGEM